MPSLLCIIGRRLKGTGVTTYSLHPGVIATQLGNDVTANLGPVFGTVFSCAKLLFKSPDEGIQTTLYCCLDESLAGERVFYVNFVKDGWNGFFYYI